MKKIILPCACILIFLFSCTNKNDMLIGQWKVVKYDIPQMPDLIAMQLSKVPDSLRSQYREMLSRNAMKMQAEVLKSVFEFKPDSVFNIITPDYTQHGSWALSKDAKMIYSRDSTATYTDTFYITTLNKHNLEFKIRDTEKIESVFGLEKIK
jgi:hypothetical protein